MTSEPVRDADLVRHGDHVADTPECWDKCGDPDAQPAELVRYETHLLRGRALGFWLCIRCGKVGTMAEWSASSFLCHHASLLLNDGRIAGGDDA